MVSVTWLILRACFWPAQISASVWIFESTFRNQLQVFSHVLFRVFLIKLTMQLFFLPTVEFQLIVPRCLQSTLLTISSLSIYLTSKTSQEFFTYHPKLFSPPLHTPHRLLVGQTSILPWYIQPINISFWMERTNHCQHLSSHFIQCFQFFLCPSYLLHTWSALTLGRC